VEMIDRGINRDGRHQLRVADILPGVHNLRVCERTTVGQNLKGGGRQQIAALLQDTYEILPVR
jgi:hypothetical protein